jgi:hypothetical protein
VKSLQEIQRRYPDFPARRPDPYRMPARSSALGTAFEEALDRALNLLAHPQVVIAILLLILALVWVATEGGRKSFR